MKLTKLQRYTIYCIMLKDAYSKLSKCSYFCFCDSFRDLTGIELDNDFMFSNFKLILPELWIKRASGTDENSGYLFTNNIERLAALKKCIEETHPSI